MSIVPSLSFCSISLSPPSWLEPKVTTFGLASKADEFCCSNKAATPDELVQDVLARYLDEEVRFR